MRKVITRIQLFKDPGSVFGNQVEGFLDVKEDADFPINFGIGDIRDISKRSGSFSKTIKLSGSKNNNLLLNNYFEVNVKSSNQFNLNKKQRCAVIQNGVVILDNCYLRLINTKKVQSNSGHIDELVDYEVEIRDNVGDFFNEINNKELTYLNLSEFNHVYTAQNAISSFNHTWVDGYKYILPYIDTNTYLSKEYLLGVYAKTYWDKIHSEAGYVYDWDALSDDNVRFDKMIIPFNGDVKKLSEELLNDVDVVWGSTVSQNINFGISFFITGFLNINLPWGKITNSFVTDNFNNSYNATTDRWTNPFIIDTPQSITYKVKIEWDFIINNTGVSNISVQTSAQNIPFRRKPYIGVSNINNVIPVDKKPLTSSFLSNGTTITNNTPDEDEFITRTTTSPSLPPGENIIASGVNEVELVISPSALGSVYELQAAAQANLGTFTGTYQELFRIKKIDVRIVPSSDAFGFNYPVEINKFVPQKIKQSDFIKSIYKMFNLYVEVDKFNPNRLIYKTRDDFYDSGEFKDWTYKLAKDKEQILQFVPELSSKRTILTYKQDDKDLYLKEYLNNTNEIYGQIEVIFDNENVRGVDKQELIFSPTINRWTGFGTNNPVWEQGSPKNNIRILLDNGTQSCGYYNIENYSGNQVQLNYYPFVSMLSEAENPNFDIAFGINDYYPYDIKNFTSNNLYTNFWRRTFAQINSGKMLTAYFWLNEEDIFKLKLNDKIKINNALWYINKIIDYKANKNVLTKVELLSVEDDLRLPRFGRVITPVRPGALPPLTPAPVNPVGPIKPIVGPIREIVRLRNENTSVDASTKNFVNLGNKNVITGDFSGVIVGDNKSISESGFYVEGTRLVNGGLDINKDIRFGEGGLYYEGLVINENGFGLDSSYVLGDYIDDGYFVMPTTASTNTSYDETTNETTIDITADNVLINGQPLSSITLSKIDRISANAFSVSDYDLDVFLVGNGATAISVYLPDLSSTIGGEKLTFKDWTGVAATYSINIIAFTGSTIDGLGSYTMNINYQSITIVNSGNIGVGWFIV
jgi:hypothetical protein